MTDDFDLFANWHSEYTQADWDAVNQRLADMDVPDYTLKPSPHPRSRTPRFCEWFRLPETKRPPQVEGKKRVYNVTGMYQNEFTDGLGSHVEQIQATINGRRLIVNKYDDGSYVVGNGRHASRANSDNLDDVIDGYIE